MTLRGIVLALALAVLLIGDIARAADRPRNVVVIVADDLGYSDLGCYGNGFTETPRIDGLAREGVKFTRAYAGGPACMPTRLSIFSGRYPLRGYRWTKQLGKPGDVAPWDPMPLAEVTFAETLRAAGRRTGYIGKWHLGGDELSPDKQGFEWVAASGKYWKLPCFFHPYRVESLDPGPDRGYLTKVLTAEAEGWLRERKKDEPFLLFVSHYAPHIPLQGEPAVVAKYEAKAVAEPPGGPKRNPVYSAMVEALDDSVGRILDVLAECGHADDTLVVFLSDNGGFLGYEAPKKSLKPNNKKKKDEGPDPCETKFPFITTNAPLRSGKATLYEGGIRVPLIVRWPGVTKPGTVSDAPLITMDLYPTVLDASSVAPDPAQPLDGVSWRGPASGAPAPDRDLFVLFGAGTIIHGSDKLISFWKESRVELYDLDADPGETRDLARERPALARDLAARLDAWFAATLPVAAP